VRANRFSGLVSRTREKKKKSKVRERINYMLKFHLYW
jgi:hypothetical protein